jgi:hypothetical protein
MGPRRDAEPRGFGKSLKGEDNVLPGQGIIIAVESETRAQQGVLVFSSCGDALVDTSF